MRGCRWTEIWMLCTVILSGMTAAYCRCLPTVLHSFVSPVMLHEVCWLRRHRHVRRPVLGGVRVLAAGKEPLEYGGKPATLEETTAVFRMQQKREDFEGTEGAQWLSRLSDQELLRLCRARARNVYGHEWKLQGSEGKAAVVESAWAFAIAHAKWREDMQMDEMLRSCRFEDAAKHMSTASGLSVLGLVSKHVAWLQASALPHGLFWSFTGSYSGPVLWVRMQGTGAGGDAAKVVRNLMHEVAAACEFANARLSVGVSQQAQVILDLSRTDDAVLECAASLVFDKIGKPRIGAMLGQMLSHTQVAAFPMPSALPMDQYPACFEHITVLIPAPTASAEQEKAKEAPLRRLVGRVGAGWRFFRSLAGSIPMADTLGAALLLDSDTRDMIQVCACAPALVDWQDGLAAHSERSVRAFLHLHTLPVPHPRLALAFGAAGLRESGIEALERDTNSVEEGGEKEDLRGSGIAPEGREVTAPTLDRDSQTELSLGIPLTRPQASQDRDSQTPLSRDQGSILMDKPK